MTGDKTLRAVTGHLIGDGARFEGYEMHVGRTTGAARPMLSFDDGAPDGAVSMDGRVRGAYVHGLFERGETRAALLAELGAASDEIDQPFRVDQALDEIAAVLEQTLDIPSLAVLAGLELKS